ncbi:MAG: hypothetical protein DMG06_18935 [Acidobacteria bacterium]|nr:MAG: hypothetical protein DMG06_18935 [Acidobacteriota bacterium]
MDDHLFFSWLEKTPWRDAIWQRLTGNWILNFPQMRMYRPVSGLWQVAMYQLFKASPLPHHLMNLLLHCGTSLLAGVFAFRLSDNKKTGWLVGSLMLLHPRAVLGISLIYNFCDPLVSLLMMLSLVCLDAVRRNWQSRLAPIKIGVLWLSIGLSLGVKEVALPLAVVVPATQLLWQTNRGIGGRVMACHAGPAVLSILYMVARTWFVGHPFRTHDLRAGFLLPPDSFLWVPFWDGLLLGFSIAGTVLIGRWHKLRELLPPASDWMLLWCGCMLLPAVHFCSQVTLRPWFFDERYWYVPLVPLTVFAGMLLARGGWLSSALGATILAVTFPGTVGLLLAAMVFLVSISAFCRPYEEELQRTVALLFAIAIATFTWQRCSGIKLRADAAASLHSQLKQVVAETTATTPIALLEFTERAVEPSLPFNGDLQWLLTPPFFEASVADRFFFAYPTWDSPPTNRFWDRTTPELRQRIDRGEAVKVYCWNSEASQLEPVAWDIRQKAASSEFKVDLFRAIPMKLAAPLHNGHSGNKEMSWLSGPISYDPQIYRFVRLNFSLPGFCETLHPFMIKLSWISHRSYQWNEAKEIQVSHELPCRPRWSRPSKAELWLFPGRRVDWLLGEKIIALRITANRQVDLNQLQIATTLAPQVSSQALHLEHYAYPQMKFIWTAESWWRIDH